MNPIAEGLNNQIANGNKHVYEMLSKVGKNLFFPKGILSQGAEAKEKAYKYNATIGMATEHGHTMYLPSVMSMIKDLSPDQALTYAPSFGLMALRSAWRDELKVKNPSVAKKDLSLPIVTNAITHALSVTADMWIDPEDAIILPDKNWGNYNLIFSVRRDAQIVNYKLFDENGRFNLQAFKDCIEKEASQRKKIIVLLNFPNNPTGYTVTPEEAEKIADILNDTAENGTNVIALTDDAYFGLFFEKETLKESIFATLCGRNKRLLAIKLDGATKENYVWGLRVGFITYGCVMNGEPSEFYDALERKTAGAVRGSISNASHLSQEIILNSLKSNTYQQEKAEKFAIMRDRAQEVKRVLSAPIFKEAWDPYPFNSGYFMCLKLKTVEAEPLRQHLLDKYGVGLISLGSTDLRVAFSCLEKADVEDLFRIVHKAIKDLESLK